MALRPRIESTRTSFGASRVAGPGVPLLPSLEPFPRLRLGRRAGDLDQRHPRATAPGRAALLAGRRRWHGRFVGLTLPAAPGGLGADGLALGLREVRRVRRLALSLGGLPVRELEECLEARRPVVDPRPRVTHPLQPSGHRADREDFGLHAGDLVPVQRCRNARVRDRSHAVGGRHGPIAGVLVVVDEHAVAFLLPPLRRRDVGDAALDLACERERPAPDLGEGPLGPDPHVHVDPLLPAGLRETGQPVLVEHVLRDEGHLTHVGERDLGTGVQVHPELVRVVHVVGAHRPRVDLETSEGRSPREVRRVRHHRHVGGPPAGEPDQRRLHPGGAPSAGASDRSPRRRLHPGTDAASSAGDGIR